MIRILFFLITFAFLHFVHSGNNECVSSRKWQVGSTVYEKHSFNNELYVHASCNEWGHRLNGEEWNRCTDGHIRKNLPQCVGNLQYHRCEIGSKWKEYNTEYEVIRGHGGLLLYAKCNQPGFIIVAAEVVPCTHYISQQSLPQCTNGTGDSIECERGKKWNANNTEYEIFEFGEGLMISAKCIQEGFHISGDMWTNCEQGRMPTTLPQCRLSGVHCSELPDPRNGMQLCSENAPRLGSHCNFNCTAAYYLRGTRIRYCMEDLQWTGNAVRCIIRPECSSPPPLMNGTVYDCPPRKILRFGDSCNFRCNAGHILVGPSKLMCRVTGKFTDDKGLETFPKCLGVTSPCAIANGNCSHYCRFINGDVQCYCHDGYRLDENGKTCTDINECEENTHDCEHLCSNTKGSYKCQCKTGYKLEAKIKCKEIKPFPVSTKPERKVEVRTTNTYNSDGGGRIINPIYRNTCHFDNGGCNQICKDENGTAQCYCHKGYELQRDNKICKDIDECLFENYGCSDTCVNTIGDAYCSCKKGFTLKHNGKHCTDIDECGNEALNNCDQKCHNIKGGYTCSCHPGYVLINDFKCEGCRINSFRSISDTACVDCPKNSHTDSVGKTSLDDCLCNSGFYGNISKDESCRDINECDSENFGCSDSCVNILGSAYCSCPHGFQLQEDQKTCSDIDECSVKNGGCQGICHNSIASFRCSCLEGYTVSANDSYVCDDVDECKENNGGCSGECINFLGGYQCSCPGDSHLGGDGKTCRTLYCPEVPVPYHSRLVCFPASNKTAKTVYLAEETSHTGKLPLGTICKLKCQKGYDVDDASKTIVCLRNGTWNTTADECKVSNCPPLRGPENGDVHPPECKEGSRTVKERCYFTCNEGYRMRGKRTFLTCPNKLLWDYTEIPNCEPEQITPYVTCPRDATVDLLPNENSSNIVLKSPESNMEDIQVVPDWVVFERLIAFPSGKTDIVVTARSPNFKNLTTSCALSVIVLDKEYPEFLDCPETLDVSGSNVEGAVVYWKEPLAVDNVGIKSIIKNAEINSTWFPGIHIVEYIAEDFAGNIARCSFEINVTSAECDDLADPENGEANCLDWVYGKVCEPSCNLNYTRHGTDTQFYVCDDTGAWTPSNFISPCLPECEYEQIWSQEQEMCVDIGINATDTYSV